MTCLLKWEQKGLSDLSAWLTHTHFNILMFCFWFKGEIFCLHSLVNRNQLLICKHAGSICYAHTKPFTVTSFKINYHDLSLKFSHSNQSIWKKNYSIVLHEATVFYKISLPCFSLRLSEPGVFTEIWSYNSMALLHHRVIRTRQISPCVGGRNKCLQFSRCRPSLSWHNMAQSLQCKNHRSGI